MLMPKVRAKGMRKVSKPKETNRTLFFFMPSMSISSAARNMM